MKILTVRGELFNADRRTDITKVIVVFSQFREWAPPTKKKKYSKQPTTNYDGQRRHTREDSEILETTASK